MLTQLSCAVGFACHQGSGTQVCSFLAGLTIIYDCFASSARHVHTPRVVSVMYGSFPMSLGSRDTGLQVAAGITTIRD